MVVKCVVVDFFGCVNAYRHVMTCLQMFAVSLQRFRE